jgi:hypothetical protein
MRCGIKGRSGFTFSRWLVAVAVFVAPIAGLHQAAVMADAQQAPPGSDDVVVVHGRVLTPDGKPAAGANVFSVPFWPIAPDRKFPPQVAKMIAGTDGRFQISFSKSAVSPFILSYGQPGADLWKKMQIAACADGLGMDWETFDHVDLATGDVVLKLVSDIPIKGRIIDLEGRPVSGVKVTVDGMASHIFTPKSPLERAPENYRGINLPMAATGRTEPIVSDADGRFEIKGLGRDRRVTLTFASDQVAIVRQWVGTREGKTNFQAMGSSVKEANMQILGSTFELTASPARSVTGVVRDAATHQPIPNVHVRTLYARIDASAVTDKEGHYRLTGLERGQPIQIIAGTDDEPYLPFIVDLPEKAGADPLTQDIEMTRGVWITGKVVDAQTGAPIPASVNYLPLIRNNAAASLPLFRVGYAQPPCNAQTSPDGSYRLIAASGPGVVGVVIWQNTNYPLGQGFDTIKSKDRTGTVSTVFPGMLSANRFAAAHEIDAAPDVVTGGIDFLLKHGAVAHIVCTAPDGKPIQKLTVFGKNASMDSNSTPPIDGNEFDVPGLRDGETRLIVIRDDDNHVGKTMKLVAANGAGKTIQVKLEPMGTVTGRLLNSQQVPVVGGKVRIETAIVELRQLNHMAILPGQSGPDGRFKMNLPVGCPYILEASVSPFGGRSKFFEDNFIAPKPGETIDMGDLQLDERMMK